MFNSVALVVRTKAVVTTIVANQNVANATTAIVVNQSVVNAELAIAVSQNVANATTVIVAKKNVLAVIVQNASQKTKNVSVKNEDNTSTKTKGAMKSRPLSIKKLEIYNHLVYNVRKAR